MSRSSVGLQQFKPHAILVAEAARANCLGETEEQEKRRRIAEEQQWKANTIDLQRVLGLAQAMFVFLENNNEALARVALEIVFCPDASKALWWAEGWYDDDKRREWFRKVVKDKLSICLNGRENMVFDEEQDDKVDRAEHEALKRLLEKVEAERDAADRQKRVLEASRADLEHSVGDVNDKFKSLEKTAEELRRQIREKDEELRKAHEEPREDPTTAGKMQALQQQLQLFEAQRKKAEERVKELEVTLEGKTSLAELEKSQQRIEEMNRMLQEQKNMAEKAKKKADAAHKKAEAAEAALKKTNKQPFIPEVQSRHVATPDHKIDALMEKAEAERHRISEALRSAEEEAAKSQAALAETTKNLEAMESRWKQAEEKASATEEELAKVRSEFEKAKADLARALKEAKKPVQVEIEEKTESKPKIEKVEEVRKIQRPPPAQGVPQEEHDRIQEALAKSKARNADLNKENIELKAANADLQNKNDRMLKMLHEIKEQLARVTAIAERKGLGKEIGEIMAESKVAETLASPEYTCFNRLYDDAKRRQEKQRKLHERMSIYGSTRVDQNLLQTGKPGSPSAEAHESFQGVNPHSVATFQAAFQEGPTSQNPQRRNSTFDKFVPYSSESSFPSSGSTPQGFGIPSPNNNFLPRGAVVGRGSAVGSFLQGNLNSSDDTEVFPEFGNPYAGSEVGGRRNVNPRHTVIGVFGGTHPNIQNRGRLEGNVRRTLPSSLSQEDLLPMPRMSPGAFTMESFNLRAKKTRPSHLSVSSSAGALLMGSPLSSSGAVTLDYLRFPERSGHDYPRFPDRSSSLSPGPSRGRLAERSSLARHAVEEAFGATRSDGHLLEMRSSSLGLGLVGTTLGSGSMRSQNVRFCL